VRTNANRTDRLMTLLAALLFFLTLLEDRWNYYASLAELLLIVRYFQLSPWRWPQLVVLAVFLIGLGDSTFTRIETSAHKAPAQPSPELEQISHSIDASGGIMAPWWLSPGLLYFSGQPIVAGSSHCGISGIVASAQFYNTTSWTEAERILKQRRVRWVVVSDDPVYLYPLLNTSRKILGLSFINDDTPKSEVDPTVAQTLIDDRFVPTWLHLRAITQQLKLYEYVPIPTS
jgi:hypothetical protein